MEAVQFTELVRDHGDPVRAFVWRRAGGLDTGVSDPDDITAEVWAIAWQKREAAPEPADPAAIRAWLFKIARLTVANHIRKTVGRRSRVAWIGGGDSASAEAIVLADEDLHAAFNALSPGEREVMALSVWEDMSPSHIAEVLEITPNAVSVRLFKARQKMAAALVERNRD